MALPVLAPLLGLGKGLLVGLGKGLLGLGKGLSKGMTAGKVAKTGSSIVGRKISAPRQDTSQTISPSYYEDPKKQSIFKRTSSDGSIKSVKITVTNIRTVLFKKQKQLAKRRKHNADLEKRFSDLQNKRLSGKNVGGIGKIGKGLTSPLSGIISGIGTAISLLLGAILANFIFDMLKKKAINAAIKAVTTNETDKIVDKSIQEVGKEETLNLLNKEQEEKKEKGNRFSRWFKRVIWGEGAELERQKVRVETGETPRYGFFGRIKSEEELKNLNDTTLIDNDNEVTNTVIINRPIEVPAK